MTEASESELADAILRLLDDPRARLADRVRWIPRDRVGWGETIRIPTTRTESVIDTQLPLTSLNTAMIEPLTIYQRTLIVALSEVTDSQESGASDAPSSDADLQAPDRFAGDPHISWEHFRLPRQDW